jgi:hypothetical protein
MLEASHCTVTHMEVIQITMFKLPACVTRRPGSVTESQLQIDCSIGHSPLQWYKNTSV